MGRPQGYNGQMARMRATIEDAIAVIVRAEILLQVVGLRVRQGEVRSGLHALLGPAVVDLEDVLQSLTKAKEHLGHAMYLLYGSSRKTSFSSPGAGGVGDGGWPPQKGRGGQEKDAR